MLPKERFFQELMKWGLKSNPRTYAHVCTQFCVDMNAPSNAASTVKEQRRVSYRTKTLMCARQDRQRAPPPDEKRKRLVLSRLREAWPRCNYISVGRSFFTLDRVIRRNLRGWLTDFISPILAGRLDMLHSENQKNLYRWWHHVWTSPYNVGQ